MGVTPSFSVLCPAIILIGLAKGCDQIIMIERKKTSSKIKKIINTQNGFPCYGYDLWWYFTQIPQEKFQI